MVIVIRIILCIIREGSIINTNNTFCFYTIFFQIYCNSVSTKSFEKLFVYLFYLFVYNIILLVYDEFLGNSITKNIDNHLILFPDFRQDER